MIGIFLVSMLLIPALTVTADSPTFAEACSASWCPNCPMSSIALDSIYTSEDYPFYYVSLIQDKNPNIRARLNMYSLTGGYAFPTVYFNGGVENFVGRASTQQGTENAYREIIDAQSTRKVKNIDIETQVEWLGDAKIQITIDVTNNEGLPYFGKLRSYVTEIESRWEDEDDIPYHFGVLDIPIDEILFIMPRQTKTFTITWDGADDYSGLTFDDIQADNLMVISASFHWIPKFVKGYEGESFTQYYFAYNVDQVDGAKP